MMVAGAETNGVASASRRVWQAPSTEETSPMALRAINPANGETLATYEEMT
jgi:hypothetical protein